MKDRNPATPREPVPLVILLPAEDHRIYAKARRVLRCLMGRKTPTIEALLLNDLHGRDPDGIADNFLDVIEWPVERGRAVTVHLREQAKREETIQRKARRMPVKMTKPPADPARN
jgi:hypothetical protein